MALWRWTPKKKTDKKVPVLPFPSDWLKQFDKVHFERLAIMTVDGGLRDEEAIKAMTHAQNVRTVSPIEEITPVDIVAPDSPINAIWANPHKQGTPEARRESQVQCMDAVLLTAFDRIKAIWPEGFISTPEIREVESEIARVQTLVLSGKASLSDFREAAEALERTIKKEIDPTSRCIDYPIKRRPF